MNDARRRGALLVLGASLLITLLFLPSPGGYFLADDHPVILRNAGVPLGEMVTWFTASRYGWYRPLFDVYIAAASSVYGLNPTGYYFTSILLFALASALVGILGWLISSDRRVAVCAGLLFIFQGSHSEAVMWISSANELLAAVWALFSMVSYIQFRRRAAPSWLLFSILTCALAFMSKETALFLPLMFVATDALFYRPMTGKPLKPRVFLPVIPFVLLAAVLAVLRVSSVNYSVSYHPLRLAKNLVYYMLAETVAFPVVVTDLARPDFYVPVLLAALSLAAGGTLWIRTRARCNVKGPIVRAALYAAALALFALIPVIPIIAERTTFLSSAGVALVLALLGVVLWDGIVAHDRRLVKLAAVAMVVYVGANAFVLLHRNNDWRLARSESRSVITQLGAYMDGLPGGAEVWLIGLPDQIGRAYAFRNAFPDAATLAGYHHPVYSVLDIDLAKMPDAEKAALYARAETRPNTRLLWYHSGVLTPTSP